MSRLNDFLIKWFTNSSTDKDEREKIQLNERLANMYMITTILIALLLLLSVIDIIHTKQIMMTHVAVFILFLV